MRVVNSDHPGIYRYSIDCKEHLCYVYVGGRIDYHITVSLIKAVAEHPDFTPDMCILLDLTELNYHPTYQELMAIRDHLKLMKDRFRSRIAVHVPHDLHDLILMMSMFCKKFGLNMRPFRNREDLQEWFSEINLSHCSFQQIS
ncbi:hypothetical protein [Mangrovibacterium diazotrophicum]|uniref:SpoIIAA-like protein n=1 Tax=Mangrovibacterium diazotrophicum TaxID=1261403 RepID=A0A419VXC4_9BACT|nr:hypothetical protein [Mangrovibacterium diazotrophicum]RKD87877.1 hypothetical protein BC643_3885 [Mangrovibacterium diazotrophicum]